MAFDITDVMAEYMEMKECAKRHAQTGHIRWYKEMRARERGYKTLLYQYKLMKKLITPKSPVATLNFAPGLGKAAGKQPNNQTNLF